MEHSDKSEQWKHGEVDNRKLNGITMKPATDVDYSKLTNKSIEEPPFPELPTHTTTYISKSTGQPKTVTTTKHAAAGVIVVEPDGRIWMYSPKNYFGGYKNTFSKGTIEKDQSPQDAAVRELHEETGLVAKVKGYLGDVERSTSVTRYYIGQRVGGAPWAHDGKETHAVRLVPIDDDLRYRLANTMNQRTGDHKVLALLNQKLGMEIATAAAEFNGDEDEDPFGVSQFEVSAGGPGSGVRGHTTIEEAKQNAFRAGIPGAEDIIPTRNVFAGRSSTSALGLSDQQLSDHKYTDVRELDPKSLYATQGQLGGEKIEEYLHKVASSTGDEPMGNVVHHEGKDYIVDGHHRLGAAAFLGMSKVKVHYVDSSDL